MKIPRAYHSTTPRNGFSMRERMISIHPLRFATRIALATLIAAPTLHAQARPPAPPTQTARRVGVLPLDGAGTVEALGFALAEILARDLAISSSLVVVERSRLDAVLREQGLVKTGRVDPATAPRTGQLVGAERLFVGRVTASGNSDANIEISSTDVATGQTSPVFAERVPLTGMIDVQERMATRAFDALRVTLTPAERDRVARRPTRSLEALVAFGHGRRLEAMGDPSQAAKYYAQARRIDPNFDLAQLSPAAAAAYVEVGPSRSTDAFDLVGQDLMLSSLVTAVLDQVVKPVGPGATCPPTCAAVPATIIVRIVR
jgi:hypothetical protein